MSGYLKESPFIGGATSINGGCINNNAELCDRILKGMDAHEWECSECKQVGNYADIRRGIDRGVDCCPDCRSPVKSVS